ncbi:hypothetical protein CPB85DRAFT_607375 [Mucidula mucida]|nr:hypothetical protein CPB85DRAFT_607375 [Mucidula mucida]
MERGEGKCGVSQPVAYNKFGLSRGPSFHLHKNSCFPRPFPRLLEQRAKFTIFHSMINLLIANLSRPASNIINLQCALFLVHRCSSIDNNMYWTDSAFDSPTSRERSNSHSLAVRLSSTFSRRRSLIPPCPPHSTLHAPTRLCGTRVSGVLRRLNATEWWRILTAD